MTTPDAPAPDLRALADDYASRCGWTAGDGYQAVYPKDLALAFLTFHKEAAALRDKPATLHCYDCRRLYGDQHGFPDLVVTAWAWGRISPTGDEGGLLCPSCICKRLYDAGIECEGAFTSGPVKLLTEASADRLRRGEFVSMSASPPAALRAAAQHSTPPSAHPPATSPGADDYDLICTNGHDRCYGGAFEGCPYCEKRPVKTATSPGAAGDAEASRRIALRVYRHDTVRHAAYLKARFPTGGAPYGLSFEFEGRRWKYDFTSFDDAGDYDELFRLAPAPAAAEVDRVRALSELVDAVAFLDKVRAATMDEQIAVGTDAADRFEKAARVVAALRSAAP